MIISQYARSFTDYKEYVYWRDGVMQWWNEWVDIQRRRKVIKRKQLYLYGRTNVVER